jgi:excisionase family DNA binding protein
MSPQLLTANDVAQRLKISRTKAFDLLNTGTIPAIHIGRNIRVEEEDLDAYISNNKMSASERNVTKI